MVTPAIKRMYYMQWPGNWNAAWPINHTTPNPEQATEQLVARLQGAGWPLMHEGTQHIPIGHGRKMIRDVWVFKMPRVEIQQVLNEYYPAERGGQLTVV